MKSINITLKPLQTLCLPFAHFKILQGLAYKLMSYDSKLSSEIHDRAYPDKKNFKFFCFSDLIGRYSIRGNMLAFSDIFSWEIRSADSRIIDAVAMNLSQNSKIEINHQQCEVLSYTINEKHFCANSIDIQMNTPIVVYHTEPSGFVRYYNPFEQEFYDKISQNIKNKFQMFCEKPLPKKVIIECKEPSDKDKCVTHYEKSIINAWYGNYSITANPELLDFIWHTGLGSKNSIGFGTVFELK